MSNVKRIHLKLSITERVQDSWSVSMDTLQETAYCESNDHGTSDVTWPFRKVNVVAPIHLNR